jgi:hypothetical protein
MSEEPCSSGEGEGAHYSDEGVAAHYESAFFYDNEQYRDW